MDGDTGIAIMIEVGGATHRALRKIAAEEYGSPDQIEAAISVILDHFAAGVNRTGSWERDLVAKIFGENW